MSSSNSPCAACKFLRRKCTQECVFAPYFPPDQPHRFANVHKVFGASNIAKLLNELNASQREDAVNTLSYEADTRLKDPVYGCVGFISILQHRLKKVQNDILNFKKELAAYIGPTAFMPMTLQPTLYDPTVASSSGNNNVMPYNMMGIQAPATVGPLLGSGPPTQLMIKEPQYQQQAHLIEAQQLAAMVVSDEQEPMRSSWDQQQEQHTQIMTLNAAGNGGGYETAAMVVATAGSAGSSEAGFNQIGPASGVTSPSLAVGAATFDLSAAAYHQIQHQQLQQQQDEQLELGALMATSANNNDVTRKS